MDLPAAWRLRTQDSDAAYSVELVTAQDVRRQVLDVLTVPLDMNNP
jgi:head-tail adaptor